MDSPSGQRFGKNTFFLYTCLGILPAFLLFIFLRMRWVGHILVWDEAMNLCSARALLSLGQDDFSNWFWRHPPLFSSLMLLLQPFEAGFAERSEWLSIFFATGSMIVLFRICDRIYGRRTALISVFLLAVVPGNVFFDVWIKRDHAVTLAGLLAILFFVNRKMLLSSLMLTLAFLSKETAVFYWVAIMGMRLFSNNRGKMRDLVALFVVPLIGSAWWYLIVAPSRSFSLEAITSHITFAMADGGGWRAPSCFYLSTLRKLLSPLGVVLVVLGVIAGLLCNKKDMKQNGEYTERVYSYWPFFVAAPAVFLLSSMPAKVSWTLISIMPPLSVIMALGISKFPFCLFGDSRRVANVVALSLAVGCVVSLLALTLVSKYDSILHSVTPEQYRGAVQSRTVAEVVNNLVSDDDTILLSSFHYWKGIVPGQACPIFAEYLVKKPAVVLCGHEEPFESIVSLIIQYKIALAILSPSPGEKADDIIYGTQKLLERYPANLRRVLIADTRQLHLDPQEGKTED